MVSGTIPTINVIIGIVGQIYPIIAIPSVDGVVVTVKP